MTKVVGISKCFELSEKWTIIKNVIVLGLAFMVHFTGYNGASNLQSSINAEAGLGTASLAAVYAGLIFSNIFLTTAIIKWLGIKLTICLSFVTYMPYIIVQLNPTFYTMIPAGILVGIGAAPLYCAKCLYISLVSHPYSKICNIPADVIMVRLLGIFFAISSLNQVWGNLISSFVISSGGNKAAVAAVNATLIPELCGANFLPSADAGKALQHQPPEKIQMLVAIFLACMVGAILIMVLGTDSMKRYGSDRPSKNLSGLALLTVTGKLLAEPNQLLLVILCTYTGYQHAFFCADVLAAFVSCSIGTGTVGYVMVMYGVADIVGCAIVAYIAKFTGRLPIMIFSGLVHTSLLLTLLIWKPQAQTGYVLFIISFLWGMSNSIWVVLLNAYSGELFPGREEAAFSNFRIWDSMGFIMAYSSSSHFRIRSKIYFQLVILFVGLICFFKIEARERKRKRISEKNACDNKGFSVTE